MSTIQTTESGKTLYRSIGGIFILVVLISAISFAAINLNFSDKGLEGKPTYTVQEGPLTISTVVSGTIQAREKVIIKSELEGSNAILYIVPEGSKVNKGDLLVQLDASTLEDRLVDQQISVQNAKASFINARENLAIVENQGKSDVEQAQLNYELAMLDLEKYEEGDYPKAQKEAQTNIILSEEEVNRSEDVEKWSKILFDEKYLSQTELQQDTITAKKAKLSLDLANVDLNLLKDFTYKRQIAELNSNVSQTSMALDREKRKAAANVVQASAELQAKQAELDQQISKLKKMEDQISKATIKAPMDGQVVYATSVRSGFHRNEEPLEEGQMVRERQELIHLPTTAAYMAEVKIHESNLEKIHMGLPVRITVDALPGKVFIGKIASIAPLPDAQSVWMNPDLKVYRTQINIEGDGEDLRSGMSCQAEIIINQFDNATYVPVETVVRLGAKPFVYVVKGDSMTPREVELGPDNNRLIQIASGLKKGETILLTPPLASTQVAVPKDETKINPKLEQMLEESKANLDQQETMQENSQGQIPAEPGQGFSGRQRGQGQGQGRPDFQNMTPEERTKAREEMRKRFENMSPEERQQMMQRFRNNQGNQGGQGNQAGGDRSGNGQRGPRGPRAPQQ